jgi:hypothetical protein
MLVVKFAFFELSTACVAAALELTSSLAAGSPLVKTFEVW